MMKALAGRCAASITLALAISVAAVGSAQAEDERGAVLDASEIQIDPGGSAEESEALELPAIPIEVAVYVDRLQTELATQSQFNVVEISEDRKRVFVWWFGDRTTQLTALLDEAPHHLVSTSIAQTVYRPSDLRTAASTLMTDGAELGVVSVSTPKDGSALDVFVDPTAVAADATALQTLASVPIRIHAQAPVSPALSRRNDSGYHIGGALIRSYWSGAECSSGFAVQKGAEQGVMFAAHCGGVGEYWVTYDNFWDTAWYNYGTTEQRVTQYDGAIQKSDFSQPAIWTKGPDSTSYGGISGQFTAPIGAEICYSGSHSGVVCGNIVKERNLKYTLGGDLDNVTGLRTEQRDKQPAAGNGDSGGPGYAILDVGNGQAARYAATIISGIPTGSGTTCTGNPGGGGRYCSSIVISTDVAAIAADSGWAIQVMK